MIPVGPGEIRLRDEGSGVEWDCVVEPFELAPLAVTALDFRTAIGADGGDLRPLTDVSWLDAVRFCNQASERAGLAPAYAIGTDVDGLDVECDWSANGFRLPTEAEWEFACRAGSTDVRYGELDDIAWYRGNSASVQPVGAKAPNAWGFHDMIGNVWEWCWDRYDPAVYGPYRVFRGGGAFDLPRACRASCRRKSHPTFHIDDLGFRLARSR